MAASMGASPCYGFLRTFLFVSLFISPINKMGGGGGGAWLQGRMWKEALLRHKMKV